MYLIIIFVIFGKYPNDSCHQFNSVMQSHRSLFKSTDVPLDR